MPRFTPAQVLFIARQHFDAGRLTETEGLCRKMLAEDPKFAPALHLSGLTAGRLGRHEVAIGFLRRAFDAAPANPEFRADLDTAIDRSAAAIAVHATDAAICIKAANAFQRQRCVDAAITCYRRALELEPDHVAALNNLSLALKDAGRLDDAVDCCRRATSVLPRLPACHGNLLYTLHFHPDSDARSLWEEHQRWAVEHADPLKGGAVARPGVEERQFTAESALADALAGTVESDPGFDVVTRATPTASAKEDSAATLSRQDQSAGGYLTPLPAPSNGAGAPRLRIGYVSPDFNIHPIGRFLAPLLAHHDHTAFEIICYSSVRRPDALTDRLRGHADRWVDAAAMSDDALAERIRGDRCDILVDLTMHMADSRLLVFARKPAPIQFTYLAYCSTTGVDAIDYRITDPYLDPPGSDDRYYAERSIRLPQTYWCYEPTIETPLVNPLPALSHGQVIFASLNNFCKASPAALALWARLLQAVPGSRLLLHALRGAHREATREQFTAVGVDPQRLEFFDLLPLPDYFLLHHRIDIALDSFPYPGGTTTCDALWMGVPTVSLVGSAAYMRSGLSILSNAGVPELAAHSQEEYLYTAIGLASDLPRLARLRSELRERMLASPLMDAPRFARNIESLYRQACAAGSGVRESA